MAGLAVGDHINIPGNGPYAGRSGKVSKLTDKKVFVDLGDGERSSFERSLLPVCILRVQHSEVCTYVCCFVSCCEIAC